MYISIMEVDLLSILMAGSLLSDIYVQRLEEAAKSILTGENYSSTVIVWLGTALYERL